MIIAVNLTNLISGADKEPILGLFEQIAVDQPQHGFVFIVTKDQQLSIPEYKNISLVVSGKASSNSLRWKLWYDFTLPSLLKKHKVNLLVNTDGASSMRTNIAQHFFVTSGLLPDDMAGFGSTQKKYLQKNTRSFLEATSSVITTTIFQQQQIIRFYSIAASKIAVIPVYVKSVYQEMDWKAKETIKDGYSNGREYFMYSGSTDEQANLVNLLKAFSFFKRRQKSNMQLLITSRTSASTPGFAALLKTYKYRDEVKLLPDITETDNAKLMATAYAFVYPVKNTAFPIIPLQAMQCNTPLILTNAEVLKEVAGDAAIYIEPGSFEDIAAKMMFVFKDEKERNTLIGQARQKNSSAALASPAEQFWLAITAVQPADRKKQLTASAQG